MLEGVDLSALPPALSGSLWDYAGLTVKSVGSSSARVDSRQAFQSRLSKKLGVCGTNVGSTPARADHVASAGGRAIPLLTVVVVLKKDLQREAIGMATACRVMSVRISFLLTPTATAGGGNLERRRMLGKPVARMYLG